ncbi:hypothetical protein [Roseiflexus sp.]
MSDHLQTVRDIYAAFGRSDIPAILDCLADNVRCAPRRESEHNYSLFC